MTLTKITSKSIKDNEIVNADLHSAAAIASTKLAKPINLADNEKIRFGTGNDLDIYHDGSNSRIVDTGTGNFIISSNQLQVNNAANTEVQAKFIENGPVELYHNGNKKLETGQYGVIVTGTLGASNVDLDDNAKAIFGTSQDFEIYHDGTKSRLHSASHAISIRSGGVFGVFNGDGTEEMILATPDGAVELYYDDSKKVETYSSGIKLNGTSNTWIQDSGKLICGAGSDLQVYHDGTSSYIDNNTNHLYIRNNVDDDDDGNIYIQAKSGENGIIVQDDGPVQLYHDNTQRLATSNDGVTIYGEDGVECQTTDSGLKLSRNGSDNTDVLLLVQNDRDDADSDAILRLRVTSGSADSQIHFGDAGNMDTGMINYGHSNNRMFFWVNATNVWQTRSNGICPSSSGKNCGFSNSSNRWSDVRSSNFGGSSDRKEKNTIVTSDLGLDFINKLKPVSFKWNDGNAGRTHYGLVAQDVEDLLPDFGKTAMDFAALCKDTFTKDDNGNEVDPYDVYSLRYMEFISPLVKAVQELTAKVAALEAA